MQDPVSLDLSWSNGTDRLQEHTQAPGFIPAEGSHEYAIEWTPDYVSLAIDGKEYQRTEKGHPGVDMQNKPMNLMLNFWAPRSDAHISDFNQDWSRGMDDSKMPFVAMYESIEVFSYDQRTKTFVPAWSDNFDGQSVDESKWTVADGVGWDQNLSNFMASQVSVNNGSLQLKMEHERSMGPSFLSYSHFLN